MTKPIAKPEDNVEDKHPRIITLDIETAPLSVYCWGLWEQNVGLEQINDEWTILSFSVKKLGERKVRFFYTGSRGADKVRDDSELLKELWKVLDDADIVITQNGVSFDIKKINARMLMAGMKPYSPIRSVDTKLVAKKHFSFTSNRLQWMSEHLTAAKKSKHRMFPGFELWNECLRDNARAWKEMREYNCIDVQATEQLYLKMLPWISGHPNVSSYSEMEEISCPKCGSKEVQKRGKAYSQIGEYHRYQCKKCGGWSRSRQTTNTKEKRKTLLSN